MLASLAPNLVRENAFVRRRRRREIRRISRTSLRSPSANNYRVSPSAKRSASLRLRRRDTVHTSAMFQYKGYEYLVVYNPVDTLPFFSSLSSFASHLSRRPTAFAKWLWACTFGAEMRSLLKTNSHVTFVRLLAREIRRVASLFFAKGEERLGGAREIRC